MIDRPTIEKIMDATNIVDVVSEFVSLKKRGVNYIGLCPFHNDSHPSFSVSPTRGICHCFTCGKGGNAINFLMELEQMTYPDALRWLARKYNIEIKERELSDEEKKREGEREAMFIVNEWAAKHFQDILYNDVDGRAIGMQYFRSRGFRDDIIRKFQLGFSLNKRTAFFEAAVKAGFNPEYLAATGLCIKSDRTTKDGKAEYFDRFSGRAMFPWFSVSGKVVAFGGRVLDSRTKGVNQKYVNSPDSGIYHKERELYGLYQAKKSIAKEDSVYMVEGYTDVISMHQSGIENVVANSGTALSNYQVRLLHRFTNNIVLLYDGDAAGIHAAMRGTDMLLEEGMNIKVLLLPDGNDPDSFARSFAGRTEEFRQYLKDNQKDFIQFKTDLLLRNETDPVKRSAGINSIVASIAKIKDQITRASYITDCAHRLGVNEAIIVNALNNYVRSGLSEQVKEERRAAGLNTPAEPVKQSRPTVLSPMQKLYEVEEILVQLIIHYGEKHIVVEDNEGNDVELSVALYISLDLGGDGLKFHNPLYNQIMEEAVAHSDEGNFEAETYFAAHPNPEISKLAAQPTAGHEITTSSLQLKMNSDKLRQQVFKAILSFRTHYIVQRIIEVQQEFLQNPTDRSLLEEYARLKEFNRLLSKQTKNVFN